MKKKGFTLAELLIVVALMGIMATVALGSYIKSQKKGRDARRKQDLGEIQRALELYYHDNNEYPEAVSFGGSLAHPTVEGVVYMVKTPDDPKSSLSYIYEAVDGGQGFRLHAYLEYEDDQDINCSGGSGRSCGTGVDCNYVVPSSGTAVPGTCSP